MDFDATQAVELSLFNDEEQLSDSDDGNQQNKQPVGSLIVLVRKDFPKTLYPVFKGKNVIGRSMSECTIQIPIKELSRRHAVIEVVGDTHLIYDLKSGNKTRKGTLVLTPEVRYNLEDGDVLKFADVICHYSKTLRDDYDFENESPTQITSSPQETDLRENDSALASNTGNSLILRSDSEDSDLEENKITDILPETPNASDKVEESGSDTDIDEDIFEKSKEYDKDKYENIAEIATEVFCPPSSKAGPSSIINEDNKDKESVKRNADNEDSSETDSIWNAPTQPWIVNRSPAKDHPVDETIFEAETEKWQKGSCKSDEDVNESTNDSIYEAETQVWDKRKRKSVEEVKENSDSVYEAETQIWNKSTAKAGLNKVEISKMETEVYLPEETKHEAKTDSRSALDNESSHIDVGNVSTLILENDETAETLPIEMLESRRPALKQRPIEETAVLTGEKNRKESENLPSLDAEDVATVPVEELDGKPISSTSKGDDSYDDLGNTATLRLESDSDPENISSSAASKKVSKAANFVEDEGELDFVSPTTDDELSAVKEVVKRIETSTALQDSQERGDSTPSKTNESFGRSKIAEKEPMENKDQEDNNDVCKNNESKGLVLRSRKLKGASKNKEPDVRKENLNSSVSLGESHVRKSDRNRKPSVKLLEANESTKNNRSASTSKQSSPSRDDLLVKLTENENSELSGNAIESHPSASKCEVLSRNRRSGRPAVPLIPKAQNSEAMTSLLAKTHKRDPESVKLNVRTDKSGKQEYTDDVAAPPRKSDAAPLNDEQKTPKQILQNIDAESLARGEDLKTNAKRMIKTTTKREKKSVDACEARFTSTRLKRNAKPKCKSETIQVKLSDEDEQPVPSPKAEKSEARTSRIAKTQKRTTESAKLNVRTDTSGNQERSDDVAVSDSSPPVKRKPGRPRKGDKAPLTDEHESSKQILHDMDAKSPARGEDLITTPKRTLKTTPKREKKFVDVTEARFTSTPLKRNAKPKRRSETIQDMLSEEDDEPVPSPISLSITQNPRGIRGGGKDCAKSFTRAARTLRSSRNSDSAGENVDGKSSVDVAQKSADKRQSTRQERSASHVKDSPKKNTADKNLSSSSRSKDVFTMSDSSEEEDDASSCFQVNLKRNSPASKRSANVSLSSPVKAKRSLVAQARNSSETNFSASPPPTKRDRSRKSQTVRDVTSDSLMLEAEAISSSLEKRKSRVRPTNEVKLMKNLRTETSVEDKVTTSWKNSRRGNASPNKGESNVVQSSVIQSPSLSQSSNPTSRKRKTSEAIPISPNKKTKLEENVMRTSPRVRKRTVKSDDLSFTSPSSSTLRDVKGASKTKRNISKQMQVDERQTDSPVIASTVVEHCIMFTGLADGLTRQLTKIVQSLGGKVTEAGEECSYLVTDKIRRTIKLLSVLSKGIPIINVDWLKKCKMQKAFIEPDPYLIGDEEMESRYKFSLKKSLAKAAQMPFLQNYFIFVTKSVRPVPEDMKAIIESAGGVFLSKIPTVASDKKSDSTVVIISCNEDILSLAKARKSGIPIVHNEFILTGVLRQQADLKSFLI